MVVKKNLDLLSIYREYSCCYPVTMAEVVGLAASIIQIAGAGAQLSIALYNYAISAANADPEIKDIAVDIELTSHVLEDMGKLFETEDAKSIVSKRALQHANNIIKKCENVFDEMSELINKGRKTGKDGQKKLSIIGKIAWPMKHSRVELHRKRLESLKSSLALLLGVLQLAQEQSRGKRDQSAMEREREWVRELHQRHQESLKSLEALETQFRQTGFGREESTASGSSNLSPFPTTGLVVNPKPLVLPPREKGMTSEPNIVTSEISNANDSESSGSESTAVDDEEGHLSLEDLTNAAEHVKKLLRQITLLQQSFDGNRKIRRRVRKMYQRFCHKFESGLHASQTGSFSVQNKPHDSQPVQGNMMPMLWPEAGLDNFDFDSFLPTEAADKEGSEALDFDFNFSETKSLPLEAETQAFREDSDNDKNTQDGWASHVVPDKIRHSDLRQQSGIPHNMELPDGPRQSNQHPAMKAIVKRKTAGRRMGLLRPLSRQQSQEIRRQRLGQPAEPAVTRVLGPPPSTLVPCPPEGKVSGEKTNSSESLPQKALPKDSFQFGDKLEVRRNPDIEVYYRPRTSSTTSRGGALEIEIPDQRPPRATGLLESHSPKLQKRRRKRSHSAEPPQSEIEMNISGWDIVDVLLEEWTVPLHLDQIPKATAKDRRRSKRLKRT
ncbi:mapkkk cascade kinase regulator ste50 [Pyrenophora seminiperda CCB06]|uniref:Mapkkk cascade kinase regulator ste50 n=1 Tax=Pyrenophora seminiperda CCB06 TaxID=1302712 RepID=A0A3M7M505_9PLEO|nr:mapkkk cascade kinase regulator ste50 [Pyrenophora seminiperda CCB06]